LSIIGKGEGVVGFDLSLNNFSLCCLCVIKDFWQYQRNKKEKFE